MIFMRVSYLTAGQYDMEQHVAYSFTQCVYRWLGRKICERRKAAKIKVDRVEEGTKRGGALENRANVST